MKSKESDNLWSFYERFLVFEEPARKWLHITRAANKNTDINLSSESKAFAVGQDQSKHPISSRLVNVLLAYEEARHFQTSAWQQLNKLQLEKYLSAQRINYWQKCSNVDRYLAQWLALAEIYWPNKIEIFSLKIQDSRLEFLQYCWQTFENVKKDWQRSVELFRHCLSLYRSKLPNNFLPTAIILVEGLTEQALLPYFAASCGLDLPGKGVMLVPAGGANKIIRKYAYWKEKVNLPIFCLFDADAVNLANVVLPVLRKSDHVYILSDGEIEDLMRLDFLVDSLNAFLAEDPLFDKSKAISADDFASAEKRTHVLDKIWRKRELGKFEKVKFAQFIANRSSGMQRDFISDSGKNMLSELAKSIVMTTK